VAKGQKHQSTVSAETETETALTHDARDFDKSTKKTNKRSHFPPHAHVCASRPDILQPGNAPLQRRERERVRVRERRRRRRQRHSCQPHDSSQ